MISIPITDIKNFMSLLLVNDVFDPFYFVEATIKMGISYHIDGHINKEFFDSDIQDSLHRSYSLWKEVKPNLFHLIKGKRLPLGLKIVLRLPDVSLESMIAHHSGSFCRDDIEGMYLNILFEPNNLSITTGVSYRTFSMDKSLEQSFDDSIRHFLKERGIC